MKTCMAVLLSFLNQYNQGDVSPLYQSKNVAVSAWAKVGKDLHVLHIGKTPRASSRWKVTESCKYVDKIYKVYHYREKK